MDEKEAMAILDELFSAQDVLRKHYGNVIAVHEEDIQVQQGLFRCLPGEPVYKGRSDDYFTFELEINGKKITCLM